jgi:hypothetical protein
VHTVDLDFRCCGDSATMVTEVMGVDMFGLCLLHHHSLVPASPRFNIGAHHYQRPQ